MQEDVLERRAADEHALWLKTELVDVRCGSVAVVRVEEQPVRQCLEPGTSRLARRELGGDFLRTVFPTKPKLDSLALWNTAG